MIRRTVFQASQAPELPLRAPGDEATPDPADAGSHTWKVNPEMTVPADSRTPDPARDDRRADAAHPRRPGPRPAPHAREHLRALVRRTR